MSRDNGRPAHLWRALALVPADRARYLLTLDRDSAAQRAAWASELYRSIRTPDFGAAIRWPEDTAELFQPLARGGENRVELLAFHEESGPEDGATVGEDALLHTRRGAPAAYHGDVGRPAEEREAVQHRLLFVEEVLHLLSRLSGHQEDGAVPVGGVLGDAGGFRRAQHRLSLAAIFGAAEKGGGEMYYLEDESPSVWEQLPGSIAFVRGLKL